jgi:hypothetical protein
VIYKCLFAALAGISCYSSAENSVEQNTQMFVKSHAEFIQQLGRRIFWCKLCNSKQGSEEEKWGKGLSHYMPCKM